MQQGDYEKLLKAVGLAAEAYATSQGLPVSGAKQLGRVFGVGDGDEELNINPGALLGRR
jgi:hypothetical protein